MKLVYRKSASSIRPRWTVSLQDALGPRFTYVAAHRMLVRTVELEKVAVNAGLGLQLLATCRSWPNGDVARAVGRRHEPMPSGPWVRIPPSRGAVHELEKVA